MISNSNNHQNSKKDDCKDKIDSSDDFLKKERVIEEEKNNEITKDLESKTEALDNVELKNEDLHPNPIESKGKNSESQTDEPSEKIELIIKELKKSQSLTKLKNYEFFSDIEKMFNIIDQTSVWKEHILKLSKTFENFIYGFGEILMCPEYHLKKIGQKVFVFNAPTNINKQLEALQNLSKKLISEYDLSVNKDFIIRNSLATDLVFHFDNDININNVSNTISKVVNVIVLSYKLLEKQQKQFNSLLTQVIDIDYSIINFFRNIEPLFQMLSSEQYFSLNSKEFSQKLYGLLSKAEEKTMVIGMDSTLKKKFVNSLNEGIFKVYNVIKDEINGFERELKTNNDLSDFIFIKDLLESLLSKINEYLKNNFEIEPMNVSRGDEFNFDIHQAFAESEKDDSLEDNKIKEVINNGFKMKDQIIKKTDVIVVKN